MVERLLEFHRIHVQDGLFRLENDTGMIAQRRTTRKSMITFVHTILGLT